QFLTRLAYHTKRNRRMMSQLPKEGTLRQLLEDPSARERVGLSGFALLFFQLTKLLSEAHQEGRLHRDLRPEQIVFVSDAINIINWLDEAPTKANGYLAPELLQKEAATIQSDLFALGAIFYECLSGQRAFIGATPLALRLATLEGKTKLLR